jgi:uncharacterized coiled-coil DUF342 family protein
MPRRTAYAFLFTALVFLLLGGAGTYLAMSIPNDIKAEAILKEARSDLQAGRRDEARQKFETVVRNYPRTDAAAAAAYALFRMLHSDRQELAQELEALRKERASIQQRIGELDTRLGEAARQAAEAAQQPPPPPPKQETKPPARRTTPTRRRG